MHKKKTAMLLGLIMSTAQAQNYELSTIEVDHEEKLERSEDQKITSKEIDRSSSTDLKGIFQKSPSLNVGGAATTGQKVFVRGVEDLNVNVQVDGAKVGGYLFHHQSALFLEPEFIKSVEVHPGTGRADDGFGALGGSVLLKTKNAFDMASGDKRHGGLLKTTYYTNQAYARPTLALYTLPTESLGIFATGTFKEGKEYKDGRGSRIHGSAEKQKSGLVKISGKTDNSTYDIGYEHINDTGLRSPRQNLGWDPAADLLSRQESRRDNITFQGAWSPLPEFINLDLNLYHSKSQIARARVNLPDAKAFSTSYGGTLANTYEASKVRIKFGTDMIISKSEVALTEKEQDNGVFIQNRYSPFEFLNLDFGARFDKHVFTTARGAEIKSDAFSPNARVEACAFNKLCLFTGYSESFRGIRPTEALLITGAVNYASNIKAEDSNTREAGVSWTRGRHSAQTVFFKTKINNLISLNRTTSLRSNTGFLETDGFESSYAFTDVNLFNARLSYAQVTPTYNGSEILNQNFGIGSSLGDTWTASLSKTIPTFNLNLGANARVVETVKAATSSKGAYQLYDLWVEYVPHFEEKLKFSLFIANVLDKVYVDHATFLSTGAREPLYSQGRDFRLTAAYTF